MCCKQTDNDGLTNKILLSFHQKIISLQLKFQSYQSMNIAYGDNLMEVVFDRENGTDAIEQAFATLRNKKDVTLHCTPRGLATYINEHYPMVRAAGGIITDGDGNRLIIHRIGFWDLPKGKHEEGETLAENALREVAEETGLGNVSIDRLATKTYHIHNRYGAWVLKQTSWFLMHTEAVRPALTPQTEEEIDTAEWVDAKQWKERLSHSYASLRCLAEY